MKYIFAAKFLLPLALVAGLSGCGTMHAVGNLESGAGSEASKMWDRWVDSEGDIAVATTWERKVKKGVTIDDIERSLASVATEQNMRSVGELPLSKEKKARSEKKEKFLKVYSYCSPTTARAGGGGGPRGAAGRPGRGAGVE